MSQAPITHEDIAAISSDFWSSMVGLPISLVDNLTEQGCNEEGIFGQIEIRGAWTGTVELRASRTLAWATAAALLDKPSTLVTVEESFDAIQEATNIVAGSIKRLLPPICKMAIPAMSGCSSLAPPSQCSGRVSAFFKSRGGELTISVVHEG
jgi:hypothetical protein